MDRPKGQYTICGIDEVGRGPLAGPVTAAALVLPAGYDTARLKDSKALTARQRVSIEQELVTAGASFGIGWVYPPEIDRINIHHAALLAMTRALESLLNSSDRPVTPLYVIVDGKFSPSLPNLTTNNDPVVAGCTAVVRADSTVYEVMAASIIAKNIRDRLMVSYGETYPEYGFDRHKGYPTPAHKEALRRHGPTPIHRFSFRGVRRP